MSGAAPPAARASAARAVVIQVQRVMGASSLSSIRRPWPLIQCGHGACQGRNMCRSLGIVAGCGTRDTLVDDNDTALSLHRIAADNVCSRGGQGASASPPYSPLDLCGRSVSAVHAAEGPHAGSITWILRTARLALRASRTVDFELNEEGRKQLVEFLQAH